MLAALFTLSLHSAEKQQREAVTLQLKWVHIFQFAGFYMAKEKGYYDAAGLDVTIKEKSPEVNIVRDVLAGKATYGISDSALVLDRMEGREVVALKAIFQHSPLALMSLNSSGIHTVEDLRGKKVMISPESSQNISVMAMLKSHGLDASQTEIVPMSFDLDDLINGNVDAFTVYVSDQPVILEEAGIDYTLLNPRDYGFDFYGDMLFTSETELSDNPERVKRFVDASMKGWRYAFDNIDETVEVIKSKYAAKEISRHKLTKEAKALKTISGVDSVSFGGIDTDKVATIANTFAVLGKGVGEQKRLEGFIYDPKSFLLTEKEQAFVAAHPTIRVSNEYDWPPYDYNTEGSAKGYSIDLMRLLAGKIGIEVEFVTDHWTNLHERLASKDIDVVHLMSKNRERMDYALYSDLYMLSDRVIVTRRSNHELTGMASLNGKRVAAVKGWVMTEEMQRRYPKMKMLYKESVQEVLEAVAYGEADATVVDYMVANHYIKEKMLGNLHIAAKAAAEDDQKLYIGVRNDWPELQALFNKALRYVTDEERLILNNKWLYADKEAVQRERIGLTTAEQIYLQNKKKLTTCVDPNWMPLEKIESGHYIGMGADYLDLFRQRLGMPIEVLPTQTWNESVVAAKARRCDMFVFSMNTPERATYMNVTKPLIAPPLVLATRTDAWFYTSLEEISDQKIGVVQGYALAEALKQKYPHIRFIYVESIEQGLKMVSRGELFGYVDAFSVLGHTIRHDYLGDLKIAGRFEDTWDLGVALRNDEPELYSVFEKLVASVSDAERRAIENRWISVTYEEGFDYSLMWKLIAGFSLVIAVMFYRNRQLVLHQRELDAKNRELEEEKAKVDYIAYHDHLTSLPNRTSFKRSLEHAITVAERNESRLALIVVDLDRFKIINDTLGHHIGDKLIRRVADLLHKSLRDSDTMARYGGDEFIILSETIKQPNEAAFVAEKIQGLLKESIEIDGYELNTSASIGIALYPDDGLDSTTLLKNADSAMHLAKEEGKNSFRFYTQQLSDKIRKRLEYEQDLRNALDSGAFGLVYQPQYDLQNGKVVGAEALLRWKHPKKGMIPPDEFIPVAEESGLIIPIGLWVLTEACREFLCWKEAGLDIETISVNVSSVQFYRSDIVSEFKTLVESIGIDPKSVGIEITESYIMEHTEQNHELLNELRQIGFKVSVDDFGTGYSSMNYLKNLPLDTIKIDKSFVDDVPHDQSDVAIIEAILVLAKSLGYRVIAEGIEYSEQETFLKEHGCHLGQGYLFSKPLDADAFMTFMRER
jgi:polar amino acid transport system substrate-binding protein